mmetsp:Transcript_29464/g.80580  ORF Transcript_29464/g.80580 Transcript_29464/m.80580 type:complete len:353 (-) Transcript_29464:223-1281(-)
MGTASSPTFRAGRGKTQATTDLEELDALEPTSAHDNELDEAARDAYATPSTRTGEEASGTPSAEDGASTASDQDRAKEWHEYEAEAQIGPVAAEEQGSYVAFWCRVQRSDDGATKYVVPCLDKPVALDSGPPSFEDSGADGVDGYLPLWCWRQPSNGGAIVSPITDKAAPNAEYKASLAELACAPKPPPEVFQMPQWNYGPVWPFNAQPTTLLLTNLPLELTQEALIEVLDREEFCGYYDFVSFPPADVSGAGLGYALVNVTKHEYGLALAARLSGRRTWGLGYMANACEVTWHLEAQGLADLVSYHHDVWYNAADVANELRPQVFSKGWPQPWPERGDKLRFLPLPQWCGP